VAQKELRSGGEFNILQCDLVLASGKVVGLKASVMGLTIFEGLDSLTVSGTITIQDAFNLASFGPIIGQEYLRLKISTPNFSGGENTIDFSSNPFVVTSVDDRVEIGNGVQATTMAFCSREFMINQRVRVRRNLIGSYSDIVKTMIEKDLDSGKELYIEPSGEKKKIIAPNNTPFDIVRMSMKNAVSEKDNQPTYLFWETTSRFNFRTLGEMYSQTPVMTYEKTISGTRTQDGARDILSELGAIENYRIANSPDTMWNYSKGIFSSELIVHDIISKSYQKHIYNYSESFSKNKHLGKEPIAVNDPDGVSVSSFPSRQYLKPTVGITTDESYQDEFYQNSFASNNLGLMQSRKSQFGMLEGGLQLNIDVVGTTLVKAGDIVNIKIPSVSAVKTPQNETTDMLYNGNFLIRNLRHDFDIINTKHTMSMNVTKDSYEPSRARGAV
tara:strand:+ start:459 stop:1784 length:1326 start_codon:yes stop_codon:yes gene_type:complete